jgi:hypothetical protein
MNKESSPIPAAFAPEDAKATTHMQMKRFTAGGAVLEAFKVESLRTYEPQAFDHYCIQLEARRRDERILLKPLY